MGNHLSLNPHKVFTLKIEEELWKDIKKRAIDQNIPLAKWILQAVAEKILREEKAQK